jgi:hypothetical protein
LPQFRSQGLSTSSGREALPKVNKEKEMIVFRMVIFARGGAGIADIFKQGRVIRHGAR